MGNTSGSGDSGITAQPQLEPSRSDTNAVYGHYGMHHYHNNVQNLNQVDQNVAQQDRARNGPIFGPIINLVNGRSEVDNKLSASAQSLQDGLDLRSAPAAADAYYPGKSHVELYDSVTKGVDPGAIGDVSSTWLGIGNGLTNLQNTVAQSIASSQVTWKGHSAEQARQSIATLGNKSGSAGQSAQLAGVLTAQQSEALATAKNSVPPPPKTPFDPQAAQQHLQTITDPIAYATQAMSDQAQASAQQAAHQQAAHVVQQYDQTVSQTSATMPAFAPAPKAAKPVGRPPISSPHLPGGTNGPVNGGPTAPHSGSTPHVDGPGSVHTSPNGTGNPNQSGTFTPPHVPTGGNQTTNTSAFDPTGPTMPPGTGLPTSGLPGSGGPGGGFTGPGSGPGGGFGGGLTGGDGSGLGSTGGGARGLSGPGAGEGAAGEGGSARSGAGAGAGATAEEAAMAERAGARGATGASGAGGMGAGRGQRGQGDAEHKRPSWLVETDESIFGTDEATAPPVIGE
jgi:hypothetical protein